MDGLQENLKSPSTLKDFIEANSKLITSLAAFIALTAFSTQFDKDDIRAFFLRLRFWRLR
jgi:hypothetical protein